VSASTDSGFAIAAAIFQLAEATESVAHQLKRRSFGTATTDMGALECVAMEIKNAKNPFYER
jgi:hypothetical protein